MAQHNWENNLLRAQLSYERDAMERSLDLNFKMFSIIFKELLYDVTSRSIHIQITIESIHVVLVART